MEASGRKVFCIDLVPNNGDAGLDELALQVSRFVEEHIPAGQKLDLIGFSMGGLVARFYVQRLGGIDRVSHLITLSSPHRGSYIAYLRANSGTRQMRPGSPFLQELNRDVKMLERIRVSSIWTPFDLMIVPAVSSKFAAGQDYRIPVIAHPSMVKDSRVFQLLDHLLCEGAKPAPAYKNPASYRTS